MKIRIIITAVIALFLTACIKESGVNTGGKTGESANVSFTVPVTRALPAGAIPEEYNIEKLRILVTRANTPGFSDDAVVVNELVQVSADATEVDFRVIVPIGNLNVYFIANETANMGLATVENISVLNGIVLNYTGKFNANGVQSPFVMYSEYRSVTVGDDGAVSHPSATVSGGKTVFTVERAVAKVTVTIDCDFSDLGGAAIRLENIKLSNAPLFSYLQNKKYVYDSNSFTDVGSVGYVKNTNWRDKTDVSSNVTGLETIPGKEIVFYVPEHLVGNADKGNYSYLTLEVKKVGSSETIPYLIPLGNGLGTKFSPSDFVEGAVPAAVSAADLTINRNIWYDISLNIKSTGPGIEVNVAAAPWGDPINVGADIKGRELKVSAVTATITAGSPARIYFNSNQPTVYVEDVGKDSANAEITITMFLQNPTPAPYTYDSGTKVGTGYIDLIRAVSATNGNYRIYLNAGGLRRQITVTVES